jgi:hypothetical protein
LLRGDGGWHDTSWRAVLTLAAVNVGRGKALLPTVQRTYAASEFRLAERDRHGLLAAVAYGLAAVEGKGEVLTGRGEVSVKVN